MSEQNSIEVHPLPAFQDNYIWALRRGPRVAIVVSGDAEPALDYLAQEHLQRVAILATHHQPDHVGGVAELWRGRDIPVYGPKNEPISTLTHPVAGGDRVAVPELGAEFEVLDIPGHTRAHIAYYGSKMVFCGDTLFVCGCGRVFGGTPPQLHASPQTLAALPEETLGSCGLSPREPRAERAGNGSSRSTHPRRKARRSSWCSSDPRSTPTRCQGIESIQPRSRNGLPRAEIRCLNPADARLGKHRTSVV